MRLTLDLSLMRKLALLCFATVVISCSPSITVKVEPKDEGPDLLMTHEGAWNFVCHFIVERGYEPVDIAPFEPRNQNGKLVWVGHADIRPRDSNKYWTACVVYTPADNLLSFANYIWLQGLERQPPWWPMPIKADHPKPDVSWSFMTNGE
jgi:hypothetical protein